MITITTNSMSVNVQNCLTYSSKGLTKSLERMSTGLKINSAADDAAGLYVSSGLKAQTSGIHQAMQNIQTASTMLMTAEGGIQGIYSCLLRVRDLCVQALNGTYSADSLKAMENEANQKLLEAKRIKESTNFNGLYMLGGAEPSPFTQDVMTVEEATADAKSSLDIIEIKTAEDLYNIRNNMSGTYMLANDIDLSSIDNWTPIGNDWENAFSGTLYGCGHKITGLTINSTSDFTGLFGYTNGATIRDLQIDGASVTSTGEYYTGTLVGYASGGTIDNVVITNTIVNGQEYTGGLVGDGYDIKIENSYSTGTVTGTSFTGGLVGGGYDIKIENSYSTGTVTGTQYTGGLAGYNSCDVGSPKISNSYSTGNVTGTSQTGGLAGYMYYATISDSYFSGTVTRSSGGETTFGACFGYDSGAEWESPSTISDTYAKAQSGSYFNTDQHDVDILPTITPSAMTKLSTDVWDMTGDHPTIISNNEKTHTSGGVNKDLIIDPKKITYISSADDLMKIKNNLVGAYILTSDIDLTGVDWTPVGDSYDNSFKGKLYGCGHKITGLNINSTSDYTGLFGYTNGATIRDLQIDSATVSSTSSYTGTLAGVASSTTIDNVVVTNTVVNGKYYTGGLAGQLSSGTISNSYSTGNVTGTDRTGGLAGYLGSGTISNSYSTGNVEGTQSTGGLAGQLYNGTISNSYSTGNVEGTQYVGGAVGQLSGTSKLLNTYSTGDVKGQQQTGGLVGYIYGSSWGKPQISNCYSAGLVERTSGTATTFGSLYGATNNASYMTVANNYALAQSGDYFATTQAGTTILDAIESSSMESLNTATGDAPADQWDMSGDHPQLISNKEPPEPEGPMKIRLQIGEYGDENSVIYVETGFTIGNVVIDFSTQAKAEESLRKVDDLMHTVNKKESDYGVTQNRLKSVLSGLTTRKENAVSANSTISDCDLAEESSNYVQQQILQQTAAALLVQANSIPQIALKLIQG